MKFTVSPDGVVRFLYDDSLRELIDDGLATLSRASHVEPDEQGCWVADMSPVQGSVLGPFLFRHAALQAEREWLERHRL